MTEAELIELWRSQRPMYEAWGAHVQETILAQLAAAIQPASIDGFLKIPATARTKSEDSIIEKAFYRGKNYANPYEQITDKIGLRFVVLLQRDIKIIENLIREFNGWTAKKDRDFEQERLVSPMLFDYQSVHYIVSAVSNQTVSGQNIRAGTPCEIQVRTLLQHAHSELTHDKIYKPRAEIAPKTLRTVAKSMALIEATGDFFENVTDDLRAATEQTRAFSHQMANLYQKEIGLQPKITRTEGLILDAYEAFATEEAVSDTINFLNGKKFIIDKIKERRGFLQLFREPSVLFLFYLVDKHPGQAKIMWPLTPSELEPIYTDLGLAFANY